MENLINNSSFLDKEARDTIYNQALCRWDNFQVTMIQEETAELLAEISKLQKLIAKLQRDSTTGIINSAQLVCNEDFRNELNPLGDEIADVILMMDQFSDGNFFDIVNNSFYHKLCRLENRLKK